jgi:hypothetical protein
MVVIDFNQVAIASFMGEMAGRGGADTEVNLPLLRHMILNVYAHTKTSFQMNSVMK